MAGKTVLDNYSDDKITSPPIGGEDKADNNGSAKPEWVVSAESSIVKKSELKLTILQWVRDRVRKIVTRIPSNKIRHGFGFTCSKCISRGIKGPHISKWPFTLIPDGRIKTYHLPVRCRECNTQHARYKRAGKAMRKITRQCQERPGLQAWFVTLTKPNVIYQAGETVDIESDRQNWVKEFKKFRERKIWKETFSGGYWFYEYTLHSPGDKIFDKKGNFIRECKTFEMNGHIHIIATGERRIPMKAIAKSWDGRIDMRKRDRRTNRPIDEKTIIRYLRGYLVKSASNGINMRPFGDIHKSRKL